MKKLLSMLAIVLAMTGMAQSKEGYIVYGSTTEGLPPEAAAMMGDMETKMYFKNGKATTEVSSMMYTMKNYIDDKGMTMLMEVMGQKLGTTMTKAEMGSKEAKAKDVKTTLTKEKKTVAGYPCTKAIVTFKDESGKAQSMDIWFTDKIFNAAGTKGAEHADLFKDIKGMPMEYTINMGEVKIKMSAKEVSTKSVPDATFVPDTTGYKMMTMAQFEAMMGGGDK